MKNLIDRQSDTISRQAAAEKVRQLNAVVSPISDDMLLVDQAEVMTELMMLPSAEPVRKKGRWVKENIVLTSNPPQYQWHCSECGGTRHGFSAEILTDFCPNCGSDMRGDKGDG